MRPAKQIKVIRSQLEILGDFKDQVDDLLRCICTVLQVGESWLEERDNKTFTDIYQFLTNQTAECISKCSSIPYGSEDDCQAADTTEPCDTPVMIPILKDDKEPSQILLRIESMENSITANSKRIKTLNQKFKEREKNTKENFAKAEETERKSAEKYEKIMEELHAASSFMLNLQKETESLSQHIPERAITDSKQEQEERNSVVELNDMKAEISRTAEELTLLRSLYEKLSNKVIGNEKRISDLCISLENQTLLKSELSSAQNTVKIDTEMESKCNDQLKDIEEKLQSANAFTLDMQSMTCQVQELQKNFCLTTQMIDPLKQDVSDISTVVTKLKASLDSFVVEQGKKLSDHEDKVTCHTVQIVELSQEIKDFNQHVGFYVDVDSNKTMNLRARRNLTCFDHELFNEGKHFNLRTGIFVVPCNGLYLCSLILEIDQDNDIEFNIHVKPKFEKETIKCITHLKNKDTIASVVFPVDLHKHDKMYIRPDKDCFNLKISRLSYFACVLIKPFPS
ncbi:myosin-9 isoform X2 [Biomphalaria glabrata]|nr:myosin-9 isoform X2 [Biomphalaria glabrata]